MIFSSRCVLLAVVLTSLAISANGARILALFGAPSRSHIISFEALTKELAARGHQLTVVSSFPQSKILPNYTDIAVPLNKFGLDDVNLYEINKLSFLKMFLTIGEKTCDQFLGHPEVQELINSKDKHFDLVLHGLCFQECFLGFAHKYKTPVIGMAPMGGMNTMLDIVGNPNPHAYVPNIMLSYSDHMTFTQRLVNTLTLIFMELVQKYILIPKQDVVMRKYFNASEPIPYVTDLETAMTSMLFLNNHVSISYPRPYLPNVIEVGGMHIKPNTNLPQDLKKFMDEAKDGVIYFSMGSNLRISDMSESTLDAFVTVFSKLKQRVLWKADVETVKGLTANVKLGKWMPQIAILAHPKVQVFITHGGLLSTQEAIYHSVPVVGIPILGDQELNMKRTELSGFGVRLSYSNVSTESLQWALDTVLNEPSYRASAKRSSSLFRDQPQTPLEQAVFWTEYVLRHNGAPHMRSAALDLAWYQYFLLDVIAFIAVVVILILIASYATIKAVARCICKATCSKKTTAQNKKEQTAVQESKKIN